VAFGPVACEDRPRRHFPGSFAVAPGSGGLFEDALVLTLFLLADASEVAGFRQASLQSVYCNSVAVGWPDTEQRARVPPRRAAESRPPVGSSRHQGREAAAGKLLRTNLFGAMQPDYEQAYTPWLFDVGVYQAVVD
jgi:hypothetical protein